MDASRDDPGHKPLKGCGIHRAPDAVDGFRPIGLLVDRASRLVQAIASPSLIQLVMRVALAVPFWRSGILKWNGFLNLSDTAVTLFTDEFMLHRPGGQYHFPAPTVTAFLSGCGEILFPILLVFGFGTRFAALGLLFMTSIVELTARWLARPSHVGDNGARDHGLGTGTHLDGSLGARVHSATEEYLINSWRKALGLHCHSSGRTI
jgi:putative oxidoreductase